MYQHEVSRHILKQRSTLTHTETLTDIVQSAASYLITPTKSQTLNPKIGVKQDFGDKMSSLWRF